MIETRPIERTVDGRLRYLLYAQDGSQVEMSCPDTRSNQLFVLWTRMFDRYTPRPRDLVPEAGQATVT